MSWVQSPKHTWWKEKPNFPTSIRVLCCVLTWTHTRTHKEINRNFKMEMLNRAIVHWLFLQFLKMFLVSKTIELFITFYFLPYFSQSPATFFPECSLIFLLFWFFVFCFSGQDFTVLYIPGCPGSHSLDQADLWIHRDPLASTSQALGLKACPTTAWLPASYKDKHG